MNTWIGLVKTDIRLLLHRPENIMSTILYGIMVLVVVHFSLPSGSRSSMVMGTAALWLALILSSVLGIPRLQHHPDAVRFLPQLITGAISPAGYFWAKMISGGVVTGLASIVLYPLTIVLFNFTLDRTLFVGFGLYFVGAVGVVIVLTLASALTIGREEWLLPLLVFPLLIPVVLAGTQLMTALLSDQQVFSWAWFHLLVAYNLLMLFGGWFLSEFLWEELPE